MPVRNLPALVDRRLAVRVTPDALRQIRAGHPWVYAESITSCSDEHAPPGTLAVIFDQKRQFAAIGLWDPTSPIRVRIAHTGKPATIDHDFWNQRVRDAEQRRRALDPNQTNAYRLLHGENDGFGGLVVDRYDDTLVCKVYTAAWLPHLNAVLDALTDTIDPARVVLRLGRRAQVDPHVVDAGLADGQVIIGPAPTGPIEFLENGLRFGADVIAGHKTGHFLDQRDNRQFIRGVAAGARVLDVFSCTGGFSVHAAAGGARTVHSVDIAAPAIDTARANMARNPAARDAEHRATVGDAFEVLAELGQRDERYDLVIIDPPSFASRAAERNGAIRAYRKLVDLGLAVLEPGGRLLQASCSSRVSRDDLVATVAAGVTARGRHMSEVEVFGHALDHPVTFPQGEYLAAVTGLVETTSPRL